MDGPVEHPAAARFLVGRYGADVENVAELGAGEWSRAFSFRLDGCDRVVRFGRHLEDFTTDRKAMDFARAELPVPAVLEIGEAFGGFYAVSERYFGVFLETLDEREWRRLIPALLRTLDTLRNLAAPGNGPCWSRDPVPGAPASWQEWLVASVEDLPGRRTSGWRARLRETPDMEEVFVAGERTLRELVWACPEIRHVLHRDLFNRNVLIAEDTSRIAAVFDWGCSIAGDFLYEIALLTFWGPWYPAFEALDFRRIIADHYRRIGLEVENCAMRLACYELHVGLEHIAYAAFTGRADHQQAIARRTFQVLQSLP